MPPYEEGGEGRSKGMLLLRKSKPTDLTLKEAEVNGKPKDKANCQVRKK
jgi:hypothetical protein